MWEKGKLYKQVCINTHTYICKYLYVYIIYIISCIIIASGGKAYDYKDKDANTVIYGGGDDK